EAYYRLTERLPTGWQPWARKQGYVMFRRDPITRHLTLDFTEFAARVWRQWTDHRGIPSEEDVVARHPRGPIQIDDRDDVPEEPLGEQPSIRRSPVQQDTPVTTPPSTILTFRRTRNDFEAGTSRTRGIVRPTVATKKPRIRIFMPPNCIRLASREGDSEEEEEDPDENEEDSEDSEDPVIQIADDSDEVGHVEEGQAPETGTQAQLSPDTQAIRAQLGWDHTHERLASMQDRFSEAAARIQALIGREREDEERQNGTAGTNGE
ncbi:hypothetical protein, partial [Escherichia coli]|uniref:hypothetical protein n=1 Tax=Escherichia coli TaxID=562 RepID=UPI00307AD164